MNEQIALGHATFNKVFRDGTVRIMVEIEPNEVAKLGAFMSPDIPVVIARVNNEVMAKQTATNLINQSLYGEQAQKLKLSGFFRTPDVWRAIGSDNDYQNWCRKQICSFCGAMNGNDSNPIEYAHVRRIADGAGTSIKPNYSGIPLCRLHHAEQHQKGESSIGGKEAVDKMKTTHLSRWAWEALKQKLGYESWKDCPPEILKNWAEKNDLVKYLPEC